MLYAVTLHFENTYTVMQSDTAEIIKCVIARDTSISEKQYNEAIAVLSGTMIAVKPTADSCPKIEPTFTTQEVADLLRISRKGVEYHIRKGHLKAVRLGSRSGRVSAESVRAILNGERLKA